MTNSKYIPHVIEPSCGVDRLFLALLVSAYRYDIYVTNIMPDTVEYVGIHLRIDIVDVM